MPGYGAAPFLGALAWAAAVTAPTCFILLGVLRLASAATNLRGRTRPFRPVHAMAERLPAGLLTLPTIRLPDGRQIPDVVLGPARHCLLRDAPTACHLAPCWQPLGGARRRWGLAPDRESARAGRSRRGRPAALPGGRGLRLRRQGPRRGHVRAQARASSPSNAPARAPSCLSATSPAGSTALPAQRSLSLSRLQRVGEILEGLAAA